MVACNRSRLYSAELEGSCLKLEVMMVPFQRASRECLFFVAVLIAMTLSVNETKLSWARGGNSLGQGERELP
jgi:hypothetical protein